MSTFAIRPLRASAARSFGAAILLGCFLLPAVGQQAPRTAEPPVAVEIRAVPITAFDARDPMRRRFGELEFRGGLHLTSSSKEFGGISAFRLARDGARFLAVSDKGRWWRGRVVYEGERPVGISDSEMAPILGLDGRPAARRGWYDAEAMAEDGGTVYLGIERANQILRFDYGRHGLLARGVPIAIPPAVRRLPHNGGLECLTFIPRGLSLGGTLVGIAERGLDQAGALQGFLIGGPRPGSFALKASDDFAVTDCAVLPPNNLLVLERRYTLMRGVAMRMRRISLADVRPNALLDGPIIIQADLAHKVDNMEALSVHRTPAGEVVLTLLSDDNFSPLQRTLLLQFTLVE